MAVLVFSSSKRRIADLKHARHCVIAAISRIPAKQKVGLRWVLMTGHHSSRSEKSLHYTVRGFARGGFAHKAIHVFSRRRSDVFPNGGKKWMPGRRRLNFNVECERL